MMEANTDTGNPTATFDGTPMTWVDCGQATDRRIRSHIFVLPNHAAVTDGIVTVTPAGERRTLYVALYELSNVTQAVPTITDEHTGTNATAANILLTTTKDNSLSIMCVGVQSGDYSAEFASTTGATIDDTGSSGTSGFADASFCAVHRTVASPTVDDSERVTWTTANDRQAARAIFEAP